MDAIILFSGGMDSTVLLAQAIDSGRNCLCLSFDYGQRHLVELKAAAAIAAYYKVKQKVIRIDPAAFQASSALTNHEEIARNRTREQIAQGGIPNTYVPGRNLLFLSYALGQAEIYEAEEIYFGSNALDFFPYVDCRPEFFQAMQSVGALATQQAVEKKPPKILAPFLQMDKKAIAELGQRLNAPLHLTFSCYAPLPEGLACRNCDACMLRQEAWPLKEV